MQTQPVMDTGDKDPALLFSDVSFDASKYIAEFNPRLYGSHFSLSPNKLTISPKIQANLSTQEPVHYEIYGDIQGAPIQGLVDGDTQVALTLTDGLGTKNISIRYYTGDTQNIYTKSITYMAYNLAYEYYGTDTYTSGWTENNCDPTNMNVQYINNYDTSGVDTIPQNLDGNTIYVLLS